MRGLLTMRIARALRSQRWQDGTDPSLIDDLDQHEGMAMTRMHNPPHPGAVLREYLGNLTVTDAAARLGVGRVALQRVVNGAAGISPDMAYRLGMAFGTSPELWAGMQLQ